MRILSPLLLLLACSCASIFPELKYLEGSRAAFQKKFNCLNEETFIIPTGGNFISYKYLVKGCGKSAFFICRENDNNIVTCKETEE